MKRGEAARRLIAQGEDPVRMLLEVVWPGQDWADRALHSRLTTCPECSGGMLGCAECGSTGLVTTTRRKLLTIQALADRLFHAA